MTQDSLQRLRKLEETIAQLKEARVRASERLILLRQQRDKHVAELETFGVSPNKAKAQLAQMADEIDTELTAIEAQIPPNLKELVTGEEYSGD